MLQQLLHIEAFLIWMNNGLSLLMLSMPNLSFDML